MSVTESPERPISIARLRPPRKSELIESSTPVVWPAMPPQNPIIAATASCTRDEPVGDQIQIPYQVHIAPVFAHCWRVLGRLAAWEW